MRIKITSMLTIGLLSLPLAALAADVAPKTGMSKSAVRSQFGAPTKEVAPVGNPPISRWVYKDFTVYFEGNIALHSVMNAKTLTTQPTVDTGGLPPIEEVDSATPAAAATPETANAPAAAPTAAPATATEAPAEAAPPESGFRFDPVTGRIIEVGADGEAMPSPTAQPAPAAAKPAEAVKEAPKAEEAPTKEASSDKGGAAAATAAGAAAAATAASKSAPSAPAPAAPSAPAPAASATPPAAPAPESQPQFRFDPVTGRIVVNEPAAEQTVEEPAEEAPAAPAEETKAAPAEQNEAPQANKAEDAASKPAAKSEPTKKPAEKSEPENSGFSVDWGDY